MSKIENPIYFLKKVSEQYNILKILKDHLSYFKIIYIFRHKSHCHENALKMNTQR